MGYLTKYRSSSEQTKLGNTISSARQRKNLNGLEEISLIELHAYSRKKGGIYGLRSPISNGGPGTP